MKKAKGLKSIRQGDVFVEKVEKFDEKKMKKVEDNCLAYGEVTGHRHLVKAAPGGTVSVFEAENGDRYFKVEKNYAVLYHGTYEDIQKQINNPKGFDYKNNDKHQPVKLDEGFYKSSIQQEFDHYTEAAKKVVD